MEISVDQGGGKKLGRNLSGSLKTQLEIFSGFWKLTESEIEFLKLRIGQNDKKHTTPEANEQVKRIF